MERKKEKIRIFALGGLGENGKNMYVVEVNEDLFVLDAGLKPATDELIGVDSIISDISYLIENKHRVKGVFLTSGHEDHIGAVPYLLNKIKVPIYGARLTMTILEDLLKENDYDIEKYKLYKVNSNTDLTFGNVGVKFFKTTHSIPDTLGVAIKTSMGNIVYTGDFTLMQNLSSNYETSFHKLSDIGREGVLALLSESLGVDNADDNGSLLFEQELKKIFYNAKNRIIMSVYSSDLDKIQKIINTAIECNKKIAITGRKMQKMLDIAVKLGYLKIPREMFMNLRFIDENNNNNFNNLVVLVTGARNEPFNALKRIANKSDKLIHLEKSDVVIIGTPTLFGIERNVAATIDLIYRKGANVIRFNKKLFVSSHASANDLKLLANFLKPKYVIPVIGEYIKQRKQGKNLQSIGISDKNIILMDNGDVAEFQNGKFTAKYSNEIPVNEILIDGNSMCDTDSESLTDRHLLASDGMFILHTTINNKNKLIIAGPSVLTKGFIYVKNNFTVIERVKQITKEIIEEKLKSMPHGKINIEKIQAAIEYKIGNMLKSEFARKPIVIPIVSVI